MIKTICRDCIFASTQKIDGLNIQTGCSLGRLDKFLNQKKANLVKNETEFNKELQQYYEIDRYCNTCRNNNWLSVVNRKNKNVEDTILEEIYPRLAIIFLLNNPDEFLHLEYTCQSIKNEEYHCDEFIVVNNSSISPKKVSDTIDKYLKTKDLVWKQMVPSEQYGNPSFVALDNINKINSNYVVFIKNNEYGKLPKNLTFKIHNSLNNCLDRWMLILDETKNIFLTTRKMLETIITSDFPIEKDCSEEDKQKIISINEELDIVKKIEKIAKLNKEEDFIKDFNYLNNL